MLAIVRVALVIFHADPARGGAERYTFQLAASLRDAGHEVSLLAATIEPEPPARFVKLAHTGALRTVRFHSFCESLVEHLKGESYDIVHAMLPVPQGTCNIYHPHAGIAAIRTSRRITWWTNPRRWLMAHLERELLAGPNPPLTLTLSDVVERQLRTAYPDLAPDATARLFNGVDVARFDPSAPAVDRAGLGISPQDTAALFVSNNFRLKGLAQTVVALAQVNEPDLRLLVVGRDSPKAVQRLAQSLGVEDRLRWLGGRSDLPALYRTADFLVLPTRRDSCSLVVLEALASGLPVISTRQNGATEVMEDGVHGFVLDGPDDPRLMESLRLMMSADRRARMREACIALRPLLSWENHVSTLLSIYQRVAPQAAQG
jgi:UDP-glucose:(heptosyl)LPS alpha-1,3-glucosyltransferase